MPLNNVWRSGVIIFPIILLLTSWENIFFSFFAITRYNYYYRYQFYFIFPILLSLTNLLQNKNENIKYIKIYFVGIEWEKRARHPLKILFGKHPKWILLLGL